MPKKKHTTFFLQTDYVDQHKNMNNTNLIHENQYALQFEKDDGPTTLSLDLNKLKNKNPINLPGNAFNLGVFINKFYFIVDFF